MASLVGHMLIAGSDLMDPNFHQTVVLIIEHDDEHAFGLIVNRATDMTIAEAWEQVKESPCYVDAPLHIGGPVQGPLMILHTDSQFADQHILGDLQLTTDADNTEQLLGEPPERIKFFVGYSGWAPGQLEGEIAAGAWFVAPGSIDQVFSTAPDLWQRLHTELAGSAQPADADGLIMPDDPTLN
jgi:putative transcriptional regulator